MSLRGELLELLLVFLEPSALPACLGSSFRVCPASRGTQVLSLTPFLQTKPELLVEVAQQISQNLRRACNLLQRNRRSSVVLGSEGCNSAPARCPLLWPSWCTQTCSCPWQGLELQHLSTGRASPTPAESALGRGNSPQLPAPADKTIFLHLLLPLAPPLFFFFIILLFQLHPKACSPQRFCISCSAFSPDYPASH